MKLFFTAFLATVVTARASSQLRSSAVRKLEEFYEYEEENEADVEQNYENFEEYMQAQMAHRSFSFTGCSTFSNNYGSNTYLTYRLCDSCSSSRSNGCSNINGDYVVHMGEFAETYSEYLREQTGMEFSPFDCTR